MAKSSIFISSVQKELARERQALKAYVEGDALLSRFFEVFLFEQLPAADRRADQVYLDQVDKCDLYLGLFGDEYGFEDAAGVSPTAREFDRATERGKTRLICVKGADDKGRHPKMAALIRRAGDQLIRRRFTTTGELIRAVYASLTDYLEQCGIIQDRPFDERSCRDATIDDLDAAAVISFVHLARAKRDFPLAEDTPIEEILTHLSLLHEGNPTNAAVLLFGQAPQRFVPCAEVRCMHFHGTEIMRPAPFYRIFKGSLFAQAEEAANFVLSVTNVSVGTRALGPQAPVRLEIPRDVVQEAIVNALVHRDYTSGGAVQVSVFSDRVEVWNPGELLPPLTPNSLRVPHRSIARNHRICEAMFLAGYIEKYGTGTLMMIRESVSHALPEPMFKQTGGEFVAVVGRDWLTEEIMVGLNLSDRQVRAVMHLKLHGRIANSDYRQLCGISKATASRDLEALCDLHVMEKLGDTGKGTYYVLRTKGLTKGSSGSLATRHKPVKPVMNRVTKGTAAKDLQTTGRVDKTRKRHKANQLHAAVPPRAAQGGTKSGPSRHQVEAHDARQVGTKLALSRRQVDILRKCLNDSALVGLMAVTGRSDRTKFRNQVLNPMLDAGLLEMTIPDKPTSRNQRYRLTSKGKTICEGLESRN